MQSADPHAASAGGDAACRKILTKTTKRTKYVLVDDGEGGAASTAAIELDERLLQRVVRQTRCAPPRVLELACRGRLKPTPASMRLLKADLRMTLGVVPRFEEEQEREREREPEAAADAGPSTQPEAAAEPPVAIAPSVSVDSMRQLEQVLAEEGRSLSRALAALDCVTAALRTADSGQHEQLAVDIKRLADAYRAALVERDDDHVGTAGSGVCVGFGGLGRLGGGGTGASAMEMSADADSEFGRSSRMLAVMAMSAADDAAAAAKAELKAKLEAGRQLYLDFLQTQAGSDGACVGPRERASRAVDALFEVVPRCLQKDPGVRRRKAELDHAMRCLLKGHDVAESEHNRAYLQLCRDNNRIASRLNRLREELGALGRSLRGAVDAETVQIEEERSWMNSLLAARMPVLGCTNAAHGLRRSIDADMAELDRAKRVIDAVRTNNDLTALMDVAVRRCMVAHRLRCNVMYMCMCIAPVCMVGPPVGPPLLRAGMGGGGGQRAAG